jgi:hypothetical protein
LVFFVKPQTRCHNYSPPWFTGRWRDWHRGHGCQLDDGKPRSAEAAAEIKAHGGAAPAIPEAQADE